MKVYFYHTQDLNRIYREWQDGLIPGHFLYGATHLPRHGIDTILHRHAGCTSRLRLMLNTAWQILRCREAYDAVYATSFRGLELIVLLRALGLFRKPVILWHHQAVTPAANPLREAFARLFYRGIDRMFFFSQKLIDDSLRSPKARPERMQMIHWGADLDFYDRLLEQEAPTARKGFISTGKEHRDMPTLIRAFAQSGQPLDIYVARNEGGENYGEILGNQQIPPNVQVHFIQGFIPYELSRKVCRAQCIVICCMETAYTVGLTTLVEALALGMPVVCSRNPNFAFDIDGEGVGLTVPYYDSTGWTEAVNRLATRPAEAQEMGRRARRLAETAFNLENCAREVAAALLPFSSQPEQAS